MKKRTPYDIVKSRYVTEKAAMLEQLQSASSNRCLVRYKRPKYVFLVDQKANKSEISNAITKIYADKKITVVAVNTINRKPKKRRVRGRQGFRPGFKKAIVTLEEGDSIDEAI